MKRLHIAILSFGLLNASLYSALLPLWEGFDEPAHYGYVESLWQTYCLPVLGRTTFPGDLVASFRYAPGSYLMRRWRAETMTYEEWYALPQQTREHRRANLDSLRPNLPASTETNYEAHHPPLAYAVLAPIDRFLLGEPITTRILILRLAGALCSAILLFFGARALCRELHLSEPFTVALLFTVFCAQMFYGAIAHVANDWLAIPLATWCFAAVAAYINHPCNHRLLKVSIWLTLGLLTKAYFLVFALWVAVLLAVRTWRRQTRITSTLVAAVVVTGIASPWYIRNLLIYGNVSGTYEAFSGVGIGEALAAAPRINWTWSAATLARGSLWMGNNSGTAFSEATLNSMLLLLVLGIALWVGRAKQIQPSEMAVLSGILLFVLAIAYAVCSSFACRQCTFRQASPWYTQVLLVPVLGLAYTGASRIKRLGVAIAISMIGCWTWVLLATWIVKLFPMYSGRGSGPAHAGALWDWYLHHAPLNAPAFSMTALAPAGVLYSGLLLSSILAVVLSVAVIRVLTRSVERSRPAAA